MFVAVDKSICWMKVENCAMYFNAYFFKKYTPKSKLTLAYLLRSVFFILLIIKMS